MGKLFPPVLRHAGVSVPVVVGVLLAMFLVLRFAQASGYEAWFSTDVGAIATAGSSAYVESSDEFSLQGSGAGVGGVGDECFFTYLFLRGDGSITAKLVDVENTNADAIGAITFREGTDSGSRQVVFGARPDGSLRLIVRTSSGASSTASSVSSGSFPQWLRLTRTGSSFAYYTSADGVSWIAHGSVAVSMDAVVRIGLVASSADDGNLCAAVFQGVATTGNTDDIDLDGLSDAWEWQHFGGLIHGPADDPDQDGLTNLQEFGLSAQPNNPDTDSDGMSDGWEAANGLDPSANDAASDGDGDGLTNLQEFVLGTHPLSSDTDADGVPDKWEVDHGTNPRTADATEDPNGDGISNLLFYQLSSSVIAHLALDSGSGGVAVDTSGNGNNGTLMNGPSWVAGCAGGGALGFDGSDDYVSLPTIDLGDQFTLAMLVKLPAAPPANSRALLANSPSGAATDGFRLFVNSSSTSDRRLVLETGNGTAAAVATSTVGAVPAGGVWAHVVAVVDRGLGTASLYVNGVDVTDLSAVRTDFAKNLALQVARVSDGAAHFEGQLDEVQVYGRKFSAADVAALAAKQLALPVPMSGLALWLKADEGVDADGASNVLKWTDYSGRGNHAVQGNSALRPRLISNAVNGRPALRFDGIDDFLDLPPATAANMSLSDFRNGLTAFIVARPTVLQTSARFLTLSRGGSSHVVSIAYNKPFSYSEMSSNLEYYLSNPNSGVSSVVAWRALNAKRFAFQQVTQSPSSAGNGTVEIRGNGSLLATGEVPLPSYSAAQPRDKNYVGRSSFANQPFLNADISEILLYQRPLSATERREVDYYFYKKYRLSIYLPPPSISPATGTSAASSIAVQIAATETPPAGVQTFIRYTTDGSEPNWNSPGFSGTAGSFNLLRSAVVRAKVFLDPYTSSGSSSSQYWINDADQDGLDDGWEATYGFSSSDPADAAGDLDGDGLSNLREFQLGTHPGAVDSNGDGFTDYTAVQMGWDPISLDSDGDGLSNVTELSLGTDPFLADTDGDGVSDQVDAHPLDPTRSAQTPPNPADTVAPGILLETPAHAVLLP